MSEEERPNRELPFDDVTPADAAMLVDRRAEVLHAHGGVVTRIGFQKCEMMTLDELLAQDVPEMLRQRDQLTVIRDAVSSRNYLVYDANQVLRYSGCEINDLPLDQLSEHLRVKRGITLMPNLTYPLVAWLESDDGSVKSITIRLDDWRFRFRNQRLGLDVMLYMPPLWFNVLMSSSLVMRGMRVAIAREVAPRIEDTALQHLPLPNIYSSGRICEGSSRLEVGMGSERVTENAVMNAALTRFWNSGWNTDLTGGVHYMEILGGEGCPVYEAVVAANPGVTEPFKQAMRRNDESNTLTLLLKLLTVLSVPRGWVNCQFKRICGEHGSGVIPTSQWLRTGIS